VQELQNEERTPARGGPGAEIPVRRGGTYDERLEDIYAPAKRSRFMTLFQAATKSRTNFSCDPS